MTARKKWSTRVIGWRVSHRSKAAVDRYIQATIEEYRQGMLAPVVREVQVWVDEGSGWRLHETVNLDDAAKAGAP